VPMANDSANDSNLLPSNVCTGPEENPAENSEVEHTIPSGEDNGNHTRFEIDSGVRVTGGSGLGIAAPEVPDRSAGNGC
jgi:hypothetical protein